MGNTIDTQAEVTPVTFYSTASNYRVVERPARRRPLGEGGDFEIVPGKDFQFYDGKLVVTDAEDIKWLRNYESFGKFYFEDVPVESSADILAEIMGKALSGDFAAIADILVAERTALSRPEVISACEAAINKGGGELPARPDTPLHELDRVRVGPAAGVTPGVSPDPVPGTPLVDPTTLEAPPGAPAAPSTPPEAPVVPDAGAEVAVSPPEAPAPAPAPPVPPEPTGPDPVPGSPAGGAPGQPAS